MIFQAIGKKKERDIEALTFAMLTSMQTNPCMSHCLSHSELEHVRELLWMTIKTIHLLLSAIPPQHAHDKQGALMSRQRHSFGVFILNSSKNNLFSKQHLESKKQVCRSMNE